MTPREEVLAYSASMYDGENVRVHCPFCKAKEKSFSITRRGYNVSYICFRATCDKKGTAMTGTQPATQAKSYTEKRSEFINSLSQVPGAVVKQLDEKYDIHFTDILEHNWRWSAGEDDGKGRLYMPIKSADKRSIGCTLRSLTPNMVPKTRVYLEEPDQPLMSCYYGTGSHCRDAIVVVEGQFDAVRLRRHVKCSIALLGCNFDEYKAAKISQIAGEAFDNKPTIVLWLDPDAFDKARAFKSKYEAILGPCRIVKSKADPKDMDDMDIRKHLDEVLS